MGTQSNPVSMSSDTVTLMSADGTEFKVKREQAQLLQTVNAALEDAQSEDVVPISNVKADILKKVLDYCEYTTTESKTKTEDERRKWEEEYLALDHPTLFQLILAANFLNCQKLLDLTCKSVADQIRGKSSEQIRQHFNIKNDFTPDEEEEVRKENQWCEDAFK
eukprot:c20284_g1_i1.p1 GENE.c20284_g1_i1~~c20284_g1_i1.p1  ORF type:complete len:164 (-),score=35.81 c20284_g1_i1:61-552(-)